MNIFFGRQKNAPSPEARFRNAGEDSNRSLELVRFDQETSRFEIGQEAIEILRQTRGPIAVMAVAGRARQGKSYILNQLLGQSGGFTVAPTHKPCTKGLWMWSQPIRQTAPDGTIYHLVLLDTEGIDAYDQTGQYSTQIFSLAVLLSSLFVYNQLGGIDEAALDRLSLVTEMTSHIRVRASDGQASDPSELAAFTPAFVWLLRDFYLRLEEDGRAVSPKEYLETALRSLPGASDSIRAKNAIRESIKSLFPDRECFTLVRPVNDEDQLSRLDSLPASQLRPQFKEGLSHLTRLLFSKATVKRLGTRVLTGPVLAGLTEAYTAAINGGAVPTIATAWHGVAEAESRRAADAAEAAYTAAFSSVSATAANGDDASAMDAAHQSALLAAQREFDGIAVGDDEVKKANERRWREACTARYIEHREKAMAMAELACERAINSGATRIRSLLSKESVTVEEVQREMSVFHQEYSASKEISGPTKWKRMAEFAVDVYGNAVVEVMQRRVGKAQQAEEAAAQHIAAAGAMQERATRAERQLERLQEDASLMQQRLHEKEQEVASARHEMHAVQLAERQAQAQLSNDRVRANRLLTELEALRQQLLEYQGQGRSWEGEKARMNATIASVTAARDDEEKKRVDAERDAVVLRGEMESLRAEMQSMLLAAQQNRGEQRGTGGGDDDDGGGHADILMNSGNVDLGGEERVLPEAPPAAVRAPDTKKMTIAAMKAWLMENGHEAAAWDLAQKKGKRADYESCIQNLCP